MPSVFSQLFCLPISSSRSNSSFRSSEKDGEAIKALAADKRCSVKGSSFINNTSAKPPISFKQKSPSLKLYKNKDSPLTKLTYNDEKWLRPHEICQEYKKARNISFKPALIVGGTSAMDIFQGNLGDCWFLCALQQVTSNKRAMKEILCQDFPSNSFEPNRYTGKFKFKFNRFGEWVEVIIDDRIPCKLQECEGMKIWLPKNAHLALQACNENEDLECQFDYESRKIEFWPLLVEKAFAQFCGSYHRIDGGFVFEAFSYLCGSVGKRSNKEEFESFTPENAKEVISSGGFIHAHAYKKGLRSNFNGIFAQHAYSVMDIHFFDHDDDREHQQEPIICLKNPWGQTECEGLKFNDDSSIWWKYPGLRERLHQEHLDDGKFWMEFSKFKEIYDDISISFLPKDMISNKVKDQSHKLWDRKLTKIIESERQLSDEHKVDSYFTVDITQTKDLLLSFQLVDPRKQGFLENKKHFYVKVHLDYAKMEESSSNQLPFLPSSYNFEKAPIKSVAYTYAKCKTDLADDSKSNGHYMHAIINETFSPGTYVFRAFTEESFDVSHEGCFQIWENQKFLCFGRK